MVDGVEGVIERKDRDSLPVISLLNFVLVI